MPRRIEASDHYAVLPRRDWQDDVEDFHRAFRVAVGETPALDPKSHYLRANLIREEINETLTAIAIGDLPNAVDGIIDSIYVLIGTAVTFGVDLAPIWNAVHASNMAKVGGEIRDDGKILKPAGWAPPDIDAELRAQGWEG